MIDFGQRPGSAHSGSTADPGRLGVLVQDDVIGKRSQGPPPAVGRTPWLLLDVAHRGSEDYPETDDA